MVKRRNGMHGSRFVLPTWILFVPLFCGVAAQAQTLDQIAVSATVQGTKFGQGQVDVTLKNGTQKTITAWAWSVEGKYVDGTSSSHTGTVDVLSDLLAPNKNLVLRPATDRTFQDYLPLGQKGDPPTSAIAGLTLVVFEDDTAIGDQLEITRFFALRRSVATMEADELLDIQKALDSASPKEARLTAVTDREAKGSGGGLLHTILAMLQNHTSSDAIAFVQASFRDHQALVASHSTRQELKE
jgi:hypothetical protein